MSDASSGPDAHPGGLVAWRWALFALLVLAVPVVAMLQQTEPLPELGEAPAFALIDQAGRAVSSTDLDGGVTVLDFIFTRCQNVCPRLTSQMAVLDDRLPPEVDGVPIRLVSITVDPDHDSPDILSAYAAEHGAQLDRWSFLTGSPTQVRATIEGFQQAAEPQDLDGDGKPDDFTHSLRFLVLDTHGRIRAMERADEEGLEAIVEHATRLARHPDA